MRNVVTTIEREVVLEKMESFSLRREMGWGGGIDRAGHNKMRSLKLAGSLALISYSCTAINGLFIYSANSAQFPL